MQVIYREMCPSCRKAAIVCYCSLIRPFSSTPRFAILIHRGEARRGVATGRMAHLCLSNSFLFEGTDFTDHHGVNALVNDERYFPVVLYPSPKAVNLSVVPARERAALFPEGKEPLFFIVDGTWAKARKMRRLSQNLSHLPEFSLSPRAPSRFRVRKQPAADCLATIEAIHEVIDLLHFIDDNRRPHDNLLDVFQSMVRTQTEHEERNGRRVVRGPRTPSSHYVKPAPEK